MIVFIIIVLVVSIVLAAIISIAYLIGTCDD